MSQSVCVAPLSREGKLRARRGQTPLDFAHVAGSFERILSRSACEVGTSGTPLFAADITRAVLHVDLLYVVLWRKVLRAL